MKNNESEKKKASKAVALITAAGMLIGNLFSSPAELLQDNEDAALIPPAAVVEYAAPDTGPDDDGDASTPDDESEEKLSFRGKMRRRILRLPQFVRALVGVPLWGIGWGITSLLSLLWSAILSPVFAAVLKWVFAAALLLLAVMLTVKAVFPDIPLKKLLNKRNFLTVFIGMGVLAAADTVLGIAIPDKEFVSVIVKAVGSLGVMALAVVPAIHSENKAREAASVEEAEDEAEEAYDYRKEILELADSVK